MTKRTKQIQAMVNIQCSNGNWNYSEYMLGLANGLILALHTLTAKPGDTSNPSFLTVPKKWLKDRKSKVKPAVS